MADDRQAGSAWAMLEHRIPPPLVMLAIAGVMIWGATVLPAVGVPLWLRGLVAAGLVGVAGLFGVPAVLGFRRVGTTVNPIRIEGTSKLVTDGVFARSRNPMYVAVVTLLLALAVGLGVPALLLGPVALALFLTRFQIIPEERMLAAKFGAEYAAYRVRVRRWV